MAEVIPRTGPRRGSEYPHPAVKDFAICFVCGSKARNEKAHFPKPYCAGGDQVVPMCVHCHRVQTHVPLSEQLKDVLDSVRARELLHGFCLGHPWIRTMFLTTTVLRTLREEGYAAAMKDLAGGPGLWGFSRETAEEIYEAGEKEIIPGALADWENWPKCMRLAAATALSDMYEVLAMHASGAK